jgi:hypothetical protein
MFEKYQQQFSNLICFLSIDKASKLVVQKKTCKLDKLIYYGDNFICFFYYGITLFVFL